MFLSPFPTPCPPNVLANTREEVIKLEPCELRVAASYLTKPMPTVRQIFQKMGPMIAVVVLKVVGKVQVNPLK